MSLGTVLRVVGGVGVFVAGVVSGYSGAKQTYNAIKSKGDSAAAPADQTQTTETASGEASTEQTASKNSASTEDKKK